MRPFKATTLLLALLVVSARSLPLNSQNSAENFELDDSKSSESSEQLTQQKSNEQQRNSDESVVASNESAHEEEDSIDEENHDHSDSIRDKRSPVIPDLEIYGANDISYQPEAPSVHPTHDEYEEWKSRQPRFRRDLDDDSLNADYRDVQPVVENSLEDYAQGCEVMEENSDENNETTYNEYRRKREASDESVAEQESEVATQSESEEEGAVAAEGESEADAEEKVEADADAEDEAEAAEVSSFNDESEDANPANEENVGVVNSAEAEAQPVNSDENNDSSSDTDLVLE